MKEKIAKMRKLYENFQIFYFQKRIVFLRNYKQKYGNSKLIMLTPRGGFWNSPANLTLCVALGVTVYKLGCGALQQQQTV